MKKPLLIIVLFVALFSCESKNEDSSEPVPLTLVELFLSDVNALQKDSTKNPIVTFSEQAASKAQETIELNKASIADALEKAKGYANAVVVVENHTIVKLFDVEDCQKSGSWGAFMPKGEGFIKKGKLNYKSDYINNIIGIPSSKKVTLYLFNEITSKAKNTAVKVVEEIAEFEEPETAEPDVVEQDDEEPLAEIVPEKDCIVNYDVSYENMCSLIMDSSGNVIYLPNDRYVTNGELKLTSQSLAVSDAWVYFYNPAGDCVATAQAQPMNFDSSSVEIVASENFSIPVHISHYKIYSWWNNASLDYLHLYYEPQNDPGYERCGL